MAFKCGGRKFLKSENFFGKPRNIFLFNLKTLKTARQMMGNKFCGCEMTRLEKIFVP